MPVETLNCPMCGAAASTDSARCDHCGARLATVACPSCFGLMFVGEKFCSHCGAKAERAESAAADTELCPKCKVNMDAVVVGDVHLRECTKCEGLWVKADSLQHICNDREEQAAVLGMPSALPPVEKTENFETKIHYLPCPVCKELMNRVNFANCSHVIVNVCSQHGTWFDRDELRQIIEFIRAGGLEKSRVQQIADLKDQERRTANASSGVSMGGMGDVGGFGGYGGFGGCSTPADIAWKVGIAAASVALRMLIR